MGARAVTLITGANGFLGRRLATALLQRGATPLLLTDKSEAIGIAGHADVEFVRSDLTHAGACDALIGRGVGKVFHLASLVSGGAEANFEAGLNVNVIATLELLEACRRYGRRPRFVFASSIAAFGGQGLPAVVDDLTFQHPRSSYGVAKVIGEQLLSDYSRRGFVDGRGLRLAAVVIRSEPNSAVSGYLSDMIREPLRGNHYTCPVGDETRIPLASASCVVDSFVRLSEVDEGALCEHRTINASSVSPRAGDIKRAVEQWMDGVSPRGSIRFHPDPSVERMIESWPREMKADEAAKLQLPADSSIEKIVEGYVRSGAGVTR